MDPPQTQDRTPGLDGGGGKGRRPGEAPPRPGAIARAGLLALATLPIGLIATAGRLTPDPRGLGTHEQLGLAPCAILRMTGRPCPTCGMTTAFAWFARGEVARSWRANPAGLLVAIAASGLAPWLAFAAATGRRPGGMALLNLAVLLAIVTVLAWLTRRALTLA